MNHSTTRPSTGVRTPPAYPDLAGRVALVTGGSRGIGATTAYALAQNGVKVALVGRNQDSLKASAERIGAAGGLAIPIAADCTSADEVERLKREVNAALGPVDILVAFAGGNGSPRPTVEETAQHWHEVIEGNLTASFLPIVTFLPDLLERAGAIITMSSAAARQAAKSNAAYAAAKAGVIGLSRHLAGELGPNGVRVNCLAPAAVENDRMRTHMSTEARAQMAGRYPLGRIGQPSDVAAATLFLASPSASGWITGVTLDVAGGLLMP